MKERITITAGSLGDYFGVGYNEPYERLAIDLGEQEPYFDADAEARMALGRDLEDSTLNYFEKQLGIAINHRNDEKVTAFDNNLRMIVDGMTVFNGEETVVECKISNSKSMNFYDNKGYLLQCQAYMEGMGVNQCLLLGLQNGKPTFRLLKKDEDVVNDIYKVAQIVSNRLLGITGDLDELYEVIKDYETSDVDYVESNKDISKLLTDILNTNKEMLALKKHKEAMMETLKVMTGGASVYDIDTNAELRVITSKRKSFNKNKLQLEHPEIDITQYDDVNESVQYRIIKRKESK